MTLENAQQYRGVGYDPAVVDANNLAPLAYRGSETPIVRATTSVQRVARLVRFRFRYKTSWKFFGALAVLHADRSRVFIATGPVNHILCYDLEQLWIEIWIRELSRNKVV